jgi:hypothetical protein
LGGAILPKELLRVGSFLDLDFGRTSDLAQHVGCKLKRLVIVHVRQPRENARTTLGNVLLKESLRRNVRGNAVEYGRMLLVVESVSSVEVDDWS